MVSLVITNTVSKQLWANYVVIKTIVIYHLTWHHKDKNYTVQCTQTQNRHNYISTANQQ